MNPIIEMALTYILTMSIGKPYEWGSNGPHSYDCSGLSTEYLKIIGMVKRGADYTAQTQWDMFEDKRVDKPIRGGLVFYRSRSTHDINHVEILLGNGLTLGASGGNSEITDIDSARENNAYVKVRPIDTRRLIAGYVDLTKE